MMFQGVGILYSASVDPYCLRIRQSDLPAALWLVTPRRRFRFTLLSEAVSWALPDPYPGLPSTR